MSELRAPDPTLSTHKRTQFVYVTDEGDDMPATAHASHYEGRRCAGPGMSFPILSTHARWFAVPCRECFPDAPPPGREWVTFKATSGRHSGPARRDAFRNPELAWQVPA